MTLSKKLLFVFASFAVGCVALTSTVLLAESRSSIEAVIVERQLLSTRKRALSIRDKLRLASEDLLDIAETIRSD